MSLKAVHPSPQNVRSGSPIQPPNKQTAFSEPAADSPAAPLGLLGRVRRGWARDSHLGFVRRVEKGVQLALQLVRARGALASCNRVGASARVAGRMRVDNRGSIVIGDHLNINSAWVPTELIAGPAGRIEIGNEVLINYGTVIAAGRAVTIGSGSMIGPQCIISDVELPESVGVAECLEARPIVIGRDVWIAGRVTIRPGVTIGDGAVVVAGSIVESDIPANVMAVGIPARLVPKLAAIPRPKIDVAELTEPPRGARSLAAVADRVNTAVPPLRGALIADFTLDDLAHELAAADENAAVFAVVVSSGPLGLRLKSAAPPEAGDFAVVWTRPESVATQFANLLAGSAIHEQELLAEVDAFCDDVLVCATRYRQVFVPTWTRPAYSRGHGLEDGRPGGVWPSLAAMNLRLMVRLGSQTNVFVMDAARWQAAVGPLASNPRAWYLGHIGAARPLLIEAARDIRAALSGLNGRHRRLLVIDSRDARWSTPSGDSAPIGGAEREAYADFHRALAGLRERGIAVEELPVADGVESNESAHVSALIARLGVAKNATVYISSRDSSRLRMHAALPEVFVPHWPRDRLLFPSALAGLRCFEVHRPAHDVSP